MSRKILSFFALASLFSFSAANASFIFGIYPENNDTAEVVAIKKYYKVYSDAVGYIFDTFEQEDSDFLANAIKTLGEDRVYHITISPLGHSAEEVANGVYDAEYRRFFSMAKESKAHFIFRTMHEANGNWYSWSGDPAHFKLAWKHIWNLAREAGLTNANILFDFSVNSEDLPSADGSVGGTIVYCTQDQKKKTGCKTFEDFYPGNEYVDIMGMTLYNWGRGRSESWAKWRTFAELLTDPRMNTFARIKSYKKPIFIDEVGTTAVDFDGAWSQEKVLNGYANGADRKNKWITDMSKEVSARPEITGILYFNRDRTQGFLDWSWSTELDWAALSSVTGKWYSAVLNVFSLSHSTPINMMPFADAPLRTRGQIVARKINEWIDLRSEGDDTTRGTLFEFTKTQLTDFMGKTSDARKKQLVAIVLQELAWK